MIPGIHLSQQTLDLESWFLLHNPGGRSVNYFIFLDFKRCINQPQHNRKTAYGRCSAANNLLKVADVGRIVPCSVPDNKRNHSAIAMFGQKHIDSFALKKLGRLERLAEGLGLGFACRAKIIDSVISSKDRLADSGFLLDFVLDI